MRPATDRLHLIGSVPLADGDQVFRSVGGTLGGWLRCLPDGETGERGRWINFQRAMLERHPAMELDPDAPPLRLVRPDGTLLREEALFRFRPGIDAAGTEFPTGYAEAAVESWRLFDQLQRGGILPAHLRFQVSLPTPMASGFMYVAAGSRDAYLAVYERALLAALGRITATVPAESLAVQWDVCQEVLLFEDALPGRPVAFAEQVFAQMGRLVAAVPEAAELGCHLCYGSPEYYVEPADLGVLVTMMNGFGEAVGRALDFVHVPVPRQRHDDAFFRPLRSWRRRPETRLYLGLLYPGDPDGNLARLAAARRHVSDFGVASDCGWGRADPARVPDLLSSHRAVAALLG